MTQDSIKINLSYNKGYKWFHKNGISVKGYVFTKENELLEEDNLINYFSNLLSYTEFQDKLKEINGLFSVVIKKENTLWAAVDHGRSFPLFYYCQDDFIEITDNPDLLKEDEIPMILDEDNATVLSYSGFAPRNKTLLKKVFQIIAGESICFENSQLTKEYHALFLTTIFSDKTREELKEELKNILEKVGKRMVKALNNRTVAIPLSGGYDSRIIAYLLKKNNYQNVFCFTYGKKNTPELKNAEKTAKNLGYEWNFIDYEKYFDYSFVNDNAFKEYVDFAASYSNKFYLQEYLALQELIKRKMIPEDSVFISGHSGAIAGHLLKKEMMNDNFSFVNHAIEQVFSLVYPRKKDLNIIRKEIDFLNNYEKKYPSFLLYENWRFQETTCKLGLNSSKLWDCFYYKYMLPLWDKELFDFFVHVPFQHKYDKNLYTEALTELFKEYDIFFPEDELFPSEELLKKVSFRSKIKKCFPFIKKFVNIWKIDYTGTQFFSKGFVEELKQSNNYRKMLSINGIYSAWYIQEVKKKLKNNTHP